MKKRVINTKYDCQCDICGEIFSAKYSNSKYCSNACKQKAYRQGYSERKQTQNTIELQLLEQQNKAIELANKEIELQNEKKKAEIMLEQRIIEQNEQKIRLIKEQNERERLKQEEETRRKQEQSIRDMHFEQEQKRYASMGSILGDILSSAFSGKHK